MYVVCNISEVVMLLLLVVLLFSSTVTQLIVRDADAVKCLSFLLSTLPSS